MGTDDLHRKRKERKAQSLQRKKAKRAPYDRVLIVCEGSKTEPNYFREVIEEWRLNTANIRITGEGGSDSLSVVDTAISLFEKDRDYDRVYCVFDKDNHTNYEPAKQKVTNNNSQRKAKFEIINSVPCFEYWLLLHYKYTRQPLSSYQVIQEIKQYLLNYKKGMNGLFSQTKDNLDIAKDNARKANEAAEQEKNDNPSTRVHELMEYLQELKARRQR